MMATWEKLSTEKKEMLLALRDMDTVYRDMPDQVTLGELVNMGLVEQNVDGTVSVTDYALSIMPTERPTTIRAARWDLVAEAVKRGECKVSRDEDFSEPLVKLVDDSYVDGLMSIWYTDPLCEISLVSRDEVLYVRWLDTAQAERDKAAGDAPSVNVFAAYVGELEATVAELKRQLAEANSAGQTSQNLWLDEKERYNSLYKDYILQQRNIEELEDERDQLASKLAAARSHLQAVVDYVSAPDKVSAKDMSEIDVILGMWSQATAGLSATPQPAPTGELVAAVKPFARMWRKWEAYAADNTDYTIMEWLQLEYSDKEFATIVYQFLEAYKAAALKGE